MWIQVTSSQGERENTTLREVIASEDKWLKSFFKKFARVEIHMTSAEFKRTLTHAWISLQVLPRLGRHAELRLEVTPR